MIFMARTNVTDRDFLRALTATNTLRACNCYPLAWKDDQAGRWDLLHLPDCHWRGDQPLIYQTTWN